MYQLPSEGRVEISKSELEEESQQGDTTSSISIHQLSIQAEKTDGGRDPGLGMWRSIWKVEYDLELNWSSIRSRLEVRPKEGWWRTRNDSENSEQVRKSKAEGEGRMEDSA